MNHSLHYIELTELAASSRSGQCRPSKLPVYSSRVFPNSTDN
jgi:hypothetical protein